MRKNMDIAYHDIRIDKDGIWYYRGAEMFRKDIVQLLFRHLRQDENGWYLIELENNRCYLDVEDTPFVIKAINRIISKEKGQDVIYLFMPDDSIEELNPSTLRIGKGNILYCIMAGSGFIARFSRASYYQIAEYIEYDSEQDEYYIPLNGHNYFVKKGDESHP
jgi:hypothetical protein